jgi:hypothetical protein
MMGELKQIVIMSLKYLIFASGIKKSFVKP